MQSLERHMSKNAHDIDECIKFILGKLSEANRYESCW